MAKNKSKVNPPQAPKVSPTDVLEMTFRAMYEALGSKLSAEEIMDRFRSYGYHHYLMEVMAPETKDLVHMEYGNALDAFEGDLMAMMEHSIKNARNK